MTELELVSASSSGLWLMYTTDDGRWDVLDLWFAGHLCGSNHKGLRFCSLEFTSYPFWGSIVLSTMYMMCYMYVFVTHTS